MFVRVDRINLEDATMHDGERHEVALPANASKETVSGNLFKDAYNNGVGFAVRHDNLQAAVFIIASVSATLKAIALTHGEVLGGIIKEADGTILGEAGSRQVPSVMGRPHLRLVEGSSHIPFRSLDRSLPAPALRLATQWQSIAAI